MSTVRCPTCGEVLDAGPESYCWGCGKMLSGARGDDELRLPPVMRQARQDAGAGSVILTVLGVMLLGGLVVTTWGWSLGLVFIFITVGFARSMVSQRAGDHATTAAVTGVFDVVLRVIAILFVGGFVLVVGAFVFLYIVCLSSGKGGLLG